MTKKDTAKKAKTAPVTMTEQVVEMKEVEVDSSRNVRKATDMVKDQLEYEAVKTLAASIKDVGLIQSVLMRERVGDTGEFLGYELWAGFRRFRAMEMNKKKSIPARICSSDVSDLQMSILNFAENVNREDLRSWEKAYQYDEMLMANDDLSARELSRRIGDSRSHISNLVRLVRHGNPEIIKLWKGGDPRATTDKLIKNVVIADPESTSKPKAIVGHARQWELYLEMNGLVEGEGEAEGEGEGREPQTPNPSKKKRPNEKMLRRAIAAAREAQKADEAAGGPNMEYIEGVVSALRFALADEETIGRVFDPAQEKADAEALKEAEKEQARLASEAKRESKDLGATVN